MAQRFRNSSTAMNTPGVSSNSIVVTKPSQVADGDTMVAITTSGIATVTPPAGWTLLGVFTATDHQANIYRRTASSEGANYTFGFSVSGACGVAIMAFMGSHDVLLWNNRSTGTSNPSVGRLLDAARESMSMHVFAWRDDATATMTGSYGSERFDVTSSNTGNTIHRGLAGYTFGPPGGTDIVNTGDTIPAMSITQSQAVTRGLHFSLLIGEKEPDNETWSSTDGAFDVELKLDEVAVDSAGSVTTELKGDATGTIAAATSSAGANEALAYDGLASTHWFSGTATGWLQYDFGSGVTKTIRRYRLTCNATTPELDPMNWTLKGSNNGTDFTVIDTRTNESFGFRGEVREFKLNGTPGAYRYYRLDITSNADGATANIRVAEFRVSTLDIWEDVTSHVVEEDKIRITRGLQGPSGRSDFSRAYLTFNNTDGRFSVRNQAGAYYGALQRNTQMRISKAYGTKSLQLQGEVQLEGTDMCGDGVRCTLTDSLSIVGDMEIRIDFEPDSWRDEQMLCGVAVADSESESWALKLRDDGRLELRRYNGTATVTYTSTLAVTPALRQSVKVTLDVNNGASGSTVAFYTATSIGGAYTQLGASVTDSTSTANTSYSGGALCVGHVGSEPERGIHGRVYNFELYTGIAGTAVSDVDFTALTNGARSFTDSNSNNWVAVNNAVVSNRRYRFHGEVAEWPIAWDPTGTWIFASVTGAGVQKRLERGNDEMSAMRRYHTKGVISNPGAFERLATPYAYWPIEDEKGAFQIASGLPSKPHMQIYGSPAFEASDGGVFQESKQLPKLNLSKYGGRVTGNPSAYADIRWLHYSPTDMAAGSQVMEMYGTGAVRRWLVEYTATNTWRVRGFNEDDTGSPFWTSGDQTITTNNKAMHVRLVLDYTGGTNVEVSMTAYDIYGNTLGNWTSTFALATVGRIYRVNVNPNGDINNTYVGHLALYGEDSPTFGGTELSAHQYESAGNRIKRICAEEQVDFRYVGSLDDTTPMGFQTVGAPFAEMSSAAVSDDGYLIDPLDAFGIEYRTRRSILNQPAALSLSYTGGELSGELRPVEDDSYITNDFTANRGGAGGSRYKRSDGNLSAEAPPMGVGPYTDEQSYSLAHEGQTVDIASWQVHKGTLDEERYPRIQIALENLRIAASSSNIEKILTLDVGKRVDITDTPDFLPADDIRQIVVGYEERFDNFQHNFSLNTIPERVFETAQYDTGSRFDGHDFTLYQDVSAAATTLPVLETSGQRWSESAADFDVLIDGERMTATAVALDTGSYSSDTFNRANSATDLGTTDGGLAQAWVQNSGTWGIDTNRAHISVAGTSVATIAGAADCELVSMEVPVWASGEAFLVFRFTDTSNYIRWGGTVGAAASLIIRSGGADTRTETCETNAYTLAAGDKLSARYNGSVIEVFRNDKMALCITDTTQMTAGRIGMRLATTAPRIDNFYIETSEATQNFTVTRAVNGVSQSHKAGAAIELYQKPYRGL